MKKTVLIFALILCLTGCANRKNGAWADGLGSQESIGEASGGADPADTQTAASAATDSDATAAPSSDAGSGSPSSPDGENDGENDGNTDGENIPRPDPDEPISTGPESLGDPSFPDNVDRGPTGRKRIEYTVSRTGVRCIADVSQLPEELKGEGLDGEFFKEHDLLLVTATVGSGSARVDIAALNRSGNTVTVTMSYTFPEIGTTDMATWLLWCPLPKGLSECSFQLANPAMHSDLVDK